MAVGGEYRGVEEYGRDIILWEDQGSPRIKRDHTWPQNQELSLRDGESSRDEADHHPATIWQPSRKCVG